MKRHLLISTRQTCALLAGLLAAAPLSAAEPQSGSPTTGPATDARTSFEAVTRHLDPGGSLYLYMSTEQWLRNLGERIGQVREIISTASNLPEDERDNIRKGFDLAASLVRQSGLEQISGVGLSAVPIRDGFYRTKFLAHHYPSDQLGFLWNLFGSRPHSLRGLEYLPKTTAFATVSDFDLPLLWRVVQEKFGHSGIPQIEGVVESIPSLFAAKTGIPWNRFLNSLGGEFGIVITLDPAHPVQLPISRDQPLTIPEPGLMLLIKVTDDTIQKRLDVLFQDNPEAHSIQDDHLRGRSLPIPVPLPFPVQLTVAKSGDYLVIASNEQIAKAAAASSAGDGSGIKSVPEFEKLSRDVPTDGNAFAYLGPEFGRILLDLFQISAKPQQKQVLNNIVGHEAPAEFFSVSRNTPEGWMVVGNGNRQPATLLAGPAVAFPAGLLAAIAIPNFVKARQTAQHNAIINNLRQIDGAKEQWALENRKTDGAPVTANDIVPYFPKNRLPDPVVGETYSINPIGKPPTATLRSKLGPDPAGTVLRL